jgi:DinB superfamily
MTGDIVDRRGIAAELERARAELHRLVDGADASDFDRLSNGTRWTNEQLLFHMVFGFMVVARLLPLVRIVSRLPAPVGRSYAWLLDAVAVPFHQVNYYGSCAAATVFNRRRMAAQCDRVIARLQRKLAAEPEANFARAMHFPVRWDPFFADVMTLEAVYRYPTKHFDFHRHQLTLGG